jgi:hypothetical protein
MSTKMLRLCEDFTVKAHTLQLTTQAHDLCCLIRCEDIGVTVKQIPRLPRWTAVAVPHHSAAAACGA